MASSSKSVEDKYKKLSQRDHILQPSTSDTYVGSVQPATEARFVFDEIDSTMIVRDVTFTPGLYKIFDEVLVNARDHKVRDANVKNIKVDVIDGVISVYNDGSGIEVEKHQEHDMYVPQLIFGELLTSANYDQQEKRTVGGKNGVSITFCLMLNVLTLTY